jgi:DNA-binding transcriptional MocR family regulator
MSFSHWKRRLQGSTLPAYQLIPDLIADDLQQGRMAPRERLPPLRTLAAQLDLNYTTVVRGFAAARERGLIASRPGMGTFTRGSFIGLPLRAGTGAEMTMNQPPELDGHPALLAMQEASAQMLASAAMPDLLRYQDFGGSARDRAIAAHWLAQWLPDVAPERVLVAPGIHAVLLGLVSMLVKPGRSLCVESLAYPGIKAIAAQLGTQLLPLAMDDKGLLPDAFEAACKSITVAALYMCPNLHNPVTATLPIRRREQLADIALRYSVAIIEDDAYGMLPPAVPPPLAELAPGLTYYVTGMSKWLGAGVRTAYVVSPTSAAHQRAAGAMRATTVMASPVLNHLVSGWLEQGHGSAVLAAMREECGARSALIRQHLGAAGVRCHPQGFHAWLPLPEVEHPTTADLAARLQGLGIAAVASNAFSTDREPPAALRLCLGGALTREDCRRALQAVAQAVGLG